MRPSSLHGASLQQAPEFFLGEASIAHDTCHRVCVHRIVARDGDNAAAVGHDDVLALPGNAKASLFKSMDCPTMGHSWDLPHRSDLHLDLAHLCSKHKFLGHL